MTVSSRVKPDRADDTGCASAPALVAIPSGKIADLELHSEHVQEVLGVTPHWMMRWGSTVIFAILAVLVLMAWIIRYPDVVAADIVVTTPTPPSAVVAQAAGNLIEVRVRENEPVEIGALLGVIQNSADPATVFRLKERLSELGPDPDHPALDADFPEHLPLGELQGDYSTFVRNYRALRYYVEQDPIGQEIRSLEPQLVHYRERLDGFLRQRDILGQKIALVERDYRRSRELTSRQLLPLRSLEEKERQLLEARHDQETVQLDYAETRIDLDKLEQYLTQLRLRDLQQRQDLRLALAESYKNLRSRLTVWERTYVLRAPVAGQVSLFKFWADHQFVRDGDEVLTIVPAGVQSPVGKVTMPIANSGKVRPGQAVFIRLDNYPYQEYGLLKGVVQMISPVPRGSHYAIEVALPQALRTSFGKQLDFRQEMQGRAEIVTEDLRLLERIFYQIRKLLMGDAQGA
jgi:multidrug resistance efflux pump